MKNNYQQQTEHYGADSVEGVDNKHHYEGSQEAYEGSVPREHLERGPET
jgi:hypothetical protein